MSKATGRICHVCGKVMGHTEGLVSPPPIKAYWHIKCAGEYLTMVLALYAKDEVSSDTAADAIMSLSVPITDIYNDLLDRALEEA